MRNDIIKTFSFMTLAFFTTFLTGCGFFDKDNTPVPKPLVEFTPDIQPRLLWSVDAGKGTDGEYLKLKPAIDGTSIYTSSVDGRITAVDKNSGAQRWQIDAGIPVTTSPGVGDGLVVIGSRNGDVIALMQSNGAVRWKVAVPGEILAQPAVGGNTVVVKTIDGSVHGLSAMDGHEVWVYQQTEPSLILRGASAPVIKDNAVFVGFANGKLSKFNLRNGELLWTQIIALPEGAFSIQRMIDIDADPVILGHHIYAATYQGKISELDWSTGKILWARDISSYTGMIADNRSIYVSDAKSHVWSFNAITGDINWRQPNLDARVVTGPALQYNYVAVGDAQGYLHWLSKFDGHFKGRVEVGSPIYATPIADQNILYVFTSKGNLLAYALSR